jgi:hypothetical protein
MFQVELENGSVEWDGKSLPVNIALSAHGIEGTVLNPGDDVLKIRQCCGCR